MKGISKNSEKDLFRLLKELEEDEK